MRRVFQWTVALSLILAVGGHWTFLQGIAWVSMAVSYSQETSLVEALQKTFNGENPCRLCKVVAAGKKAEEQKPGALLKVDPKLEFLCLRSSVVVYPPHVIPLSSTQFFLSSGRTDRPPTPPPRLA